MRKRRPKNRHTHFFGVKFPPSPPLKCRSNRACVCVCVWRKIVPLFSHHHTTRAFKSCQNQRLASFFPFPFIFGGVRLILQSRGKIVHKTANRANDPRQESVRNWWGLASFFRLFIFWPVREKFNHRLHSTGAGKGKRRKN